MAGDTAQVVFDTTAPVTAPANQAAIARLTADLAMLPHVVGVRPPLGAAGARQVASDGHIAYATVQFDATSYQLSKQTVQAVITTAEHARRPGFGVQLGGTPISSGGGGGARAERGHRHRRGHADHAAGLRLGGGHGAAHRDRPVRPHRRGVAWSKC